MDLSTPPIAAQSLPINAVDLRATLGSVFRGEGVVPRSTSTASPVTQSATPGMSIVVNPFAAVIRYGAWTTDFSATYLVYSEAELALSVASAPPSGTRTDLVIARVYDTDLGAAASKATVEVLTGTTTVPDGAEELARITVAAGATTVVNANITGPTKYASTLGAPLQVDAEANLPSASALPNGTKAYCRDTQATWAVYGGLWVFEVAAPIRKVVASDWTTNNGTLATVTGLTTALPANSTYAFEVDLAAYGATGDIEVVVATAGGTGSTLVHFHGPAYPTTNVANTGNVHMRSFSSTGSAVIGTDNTWNAYGLLRFEAVTGASPGSVTVQAKSTTPPQVVGFRAGSRMLARRVA